MERSEIRESRDAGPGLRGACHRAALRADPLAVCRAWSTAWRWKSFIQPDGGEGLAKRKGVVARRGLKEAWSKVAAR